MTDDTMPERIWIAIGDHDWYEEEPEPYIRANGDTEGATEYRRHDEARADEAKALLEDVREWQACLDHDGYDNKELLDRLAAFLEATPSPAE